MATAKWERMLRKLQERLGLQQWQIALYCHDVDCLDGGDLATVVYTFATLTARVNVATRRDQAAVEQSLRHELVHLALVEFTHLAETTADRLGEEAAKIMRRCLSDAEHVVVTRISRAL